MMKFFILICTLKNTILRHTSTENKVLSTKKQQLMDGSSIEPWCGGSNLVDAPFPDSLGQCCPFKYGSSKSLMEEIKRGTTEKHKCNFPLWMELQEDALIKLSLDTVFHMPDPTWSVEGYLFDNYELKWENYKDWVQQLKTGVTNGNGLLGPMKLPACSFDHKNLEWSGMFLLGSLTDNFRLETIPT